MKTPDSPLWARAVSGVFHPLFAPSWTLALLMAWHPSEHGFHFWPLLVLLFSSTVLFPLAVSALWIRTGRMESLRRSSPRDRQWSYIITALGLYLSYQWADYHELPLSLQAPLLGGCMSLLLLLLLPPRWKASGHMAGLWGATMGVVFSVLSWGVSPYYLFGLLITQGLVGSALLRLNRHSSGELLIGSFLGALPTGLFLYFLRAIGH